MDSISTLEQLRRAHVPRLPELLTAGSGAARPQPGEPSGAAGDAAAIRDAFPRLFGAPAVRFARAEGCAETRSLRAGVVLSGGQAPGGHNVIAGLFDGIGAAAGDAELVGFLGGPKGIFEGASRTLTSSEIDAHRNTGGFDLIGSGRDKIETREQLDACARICAELRLDGLVVVGGDDSNTNAAALAEHFLATDVKTVVVGVPKTIDGDLKGGGVEASFGFDTATKLYSELIGNLSRDARSARKYWHFVKLMGRSASHVTLECALATRVNVALIGEEVRAEGQTLREVTASVAQVVRRRAAEGRNYGVCLVPEGLIEFIPEIGALIGELNALLSGDDGEIDRDRIAASLSPPAAAAFDALPERIRAQLLLDRDSHGNVQVSRIDTERLLIETVARELDGAVPFSTQHHFFGYEGRCAAPSNFDAGYTMALGRVAALLIAHDLTGYLSSVGNLAARPEEWTAGGIPLTSLMCIETRKGKPTPVIAKALVDLHGAPFGYFAAARDGWAGDDAYHYPGPIQYFGPSELTDGTTHTLRLESAR